MKKKLLIFIALLLSVSLIAGCGGGSSGSGSSDTAQNSDQTSQNSDQTSQGAGQGTDVSGLGDKLAAAYIDMFEGGKYYMKAKMETEYSGQTQEVAQEVAVDGDNFASISSVGGQTIKMIIKDNKMHMVSDASKTDTVMPVNPSTETSDGALPDAGYTYTGSGTAELLGVSHQYEEYSVAGGGTVRFYFDGSNLVGFESASDGVSVQMEILEISGNIPAGMFDIPADYTVTQM